MWVVFNIVTGYSEESMRFAAFDDAESYIRDNEDPERDVLLSKRWETESPHPQNFVALGQVIESGTGKWQDYARDTPSKAIRWAEGQPTGKARVVDWISREVMWP